jgi:hypothetical protein
MSALAFASSWYIFDSYFRDTSIDEAIATVAQEMQSCKNLNFSPSSELMCMLEDYHQELQHKTQKWNFAWLFDEFSVTDKDTSDLISLNKKMLQSYVRDLQEYSKMKLPTTSNIVRFTYDKVVRLTIGLAELEKNKHIAASEYRKKLIRMREITKQAIVHSKQTLWSYMHDRLADTDIRVSNERNYLTNKIGHFIALDRIICT